MKNFTAFVKNKFVLAFFFLAILYPLLMLGIFLPSYAHINNSIEDISVVIVDQDNNYGAELTEALESQLPFTIIDDLSYEEALAELDQAKVAWSSIFLPIFPPKSLPVRPRRSIIIEAATCQ